MTSADLPAVGRIADVVHPSYPEDAAVFAERLSLYPQGCRVLEREGAIEGYVISHPWHDGGPPALNTLVGKLPATPAVYYIHDLALLPPARKAGAGAAIVRNLITQARRAGFKKIELVAVSGSERFWRRQGFRPADRENLTVKLASYGSGAFFMKLQLG